MTATLVSLFVIFIIALAAPLVASSIPGKPIPEVVFLIFLGALLGPHMAGLFQLTEGVETVSELGVAFLFLIAGFELDPREMTNRTGRVAAVTWFVGFGVALAIVMLFGTDGSVSAGGPIGPHHFALAIALSTTAYGTLAPILKERGLVTTTLGKVVQAHGVAGELFPVLAIAILLSMRARWQAILILVIFFVVAALTALLPVKARSMGSRVYAAIERLRDTTAQTMLRFVVLILLGLVALASVFDLDIVLGAFAAGFVVRAILPKDDERVAHKVEVLGFGFFIPVFFVVSGAGIDLAAVAAAPLSLVLFVILLLVARGVPVFLSTFFDPAARSFSVLQRLNVALYATMALPLIVAVSTVAVEGGFLTQDAASILITAGAVSVLLMPVLTSLTRVAVESMPVAEARDLRAHPDQREEVREAYRRLREDAHALYRAMNVRGADGSLLDPVDGIERVGKEVRRRRAELLDGVIGRYLERQDASGPSDERGSDAADSDAGSSDAATADATRTFGGAPDASASEKTQK